ncbi:MAG: RluA family pseudouridine synthase [Phycisphaerales bacterium]
MSRKPPRGDRPDKPPRIVPHPSKDPLLTKGGKVDADALRAASSAPAPEDPAAEADALEQPSDDDGPVHVRFQLSRDLQKRLDKYLVDRIPFMSRTQLQRLIDNEAVTVNERTPKASTVLRVGDVVDVIVPPPPSKEIQPEEIPLEVLFEDADILVVNKSPDIIVHPARSHLSGTMVNALAWHFRNKSSGALSGVGQEFARPGVVHRLDRHTSGVIVFAKRDEAHWKLGRQFEKRQVEKRYLAVVHGSVQTPVDLIEFPIGPSPSRIKGHREKQVVRYDELGKPAVTICRVLERFDNFTLVELELKTGRTHQIRVHLSHLGHPIVADDMYGGSYSTVADCARSSAAAKEAAARWGMRPDEPILSRHALHACMLGFQHPLTLQRMLFTAPVPADMARLIGVLRDVAPGNGRLDAPGAMIDLDMAVPSADRISGS